MADQITDQKIGQIKIKKQPIKNCQNRKVSVDGKIGDFCRLRSTATFTSAILPTYFLTSKGCEAKCVCDDGLYRSRETGHCVPIEEACERQCRTGTSLERIT